MKAKIVEQVLSDKSMAFGVELYDGYDDGAPLVATLDCESKVAAQKLLDALIEHSSDVVRG